jgi:hypothetical protein
MDDPHLCMKPAKVVVVAIKRAAGARRLQVIET